MSGDIELTTALGIMYYTIPWISRKSCQPLETLPRPLANAPVQMRQSGTVYCCSRYPRFFDASHKREPFVKGQQIVLRRVSTDWEYKNGSRSLKLALQSATS